MGQGSLLALRLLCLDFEFSDSPHDVDLSNEIPPDKMRCTENGHSNIFWTECDQHIICMCVYIHIYTICLDVHAKLRLCPGIPSQGIAHSQHSSEKLQKPWLYEALQVVETSRKFPSVTPCPMYKYIYPHSHDIKRVANYSIQRFPEIGVPPNHPFIDGIFHYKPSGYPHWWKPAYN